MNKLYKTSYLFTLLTVGTLSLRAYEPGYVWQFNLDENLPGSDEPIVDTNWNLHYGPTAIDGGQAANTGAGDGSIVSGNSEGSTGGIAKPLQELSNNDRGFMFGSGVGDSTTGFAPQAMFFWTTNLNVVNFEQGAKGSGTVETDWMAPAYPARIALDTVRIGDMAGLSVQTLPRNTALVYRIAIRLGTTWYVDAAGHTNATRTAWETYSMDFQSGSLYELPFTAGSALDLDVTDNTLVSVASLDPAAVITGYGIYVDTGDAKGSSNDTGSWARFDAFYIDALASAPPVVVNAPSGGSITVDVDSAAGRSYQLIRDTTLPGTFPTSIGTPASGTGGIVTLTDPDYGTLGSDKVFYRVEPSLE